MTGVDPNNPPWLPYRNLVSSNKHDIDGFDMSKISVFTPLLDGLPVITKYAVANASMKKQQFWNGLAIVSVCIKIVTWKICHCSDWLFSWKIQFINDIYIKDNFHTC